MTAWQEIRPRIARRATRRPREGARGGAVASGLVGRDLEYRVPALLSTQRG